jgi:amino acid adenylation domain-containing protein
VPLTPVIWNLDRRMADLPVGEATASFRTNARVSENFELFINGTETDQGIVLETTFSTRLFERATIRRWMEELTVLMRAVVSDPTVALGSLPVLTDAEREQLVSGLNRTELALPNVPTVLELVEDQVRRSPDKVAVEDERGTLTYAELDRQANHLAHGLRELGVKRDDCVGVCLERSARIPVVLLAVWKAGGAYVPLDPEYPPARLEYVAKDAAVRVLVTEGHLGHVLGGMDIRRVLVDQDQGSRDDAPPRDASPSQLAYVLHTSGSTGQPKGVLIEQGSFVNLMASLMSWPGMKASDVLVAIITLSFDMSGVEIFLPLVSGAKVVIASRDAAMDANLLARLLGSSGATVLQATPVTWRFLVETPWKGGPNFRGFTGGEPLSPDLATAMLERLGEVWNLYGPTENTVYATGTRVTSSEGITIGRPVSNSQAYILDEERQLVPTGARGELYMGGRCVARGYLNRPDLTQERFLPDPFRPGPGAQLYRTGDVVHYDPAGNIVYEGRNDSQVKLRGFRIELGEIESLLNQHPTVRQSAAAVRDFGRGDNRLACYVVAREGQTIDTPALQDYLRSKVPPYMVPQHVAVLDAMPLTPNGKIDRRALPDPTPGASGERDYVPPTTSVQKRLADTWAEVLRVRRVGLRDAFFDLGGHSMLAVRLIARIRDTFDVDLPIRTVFQAQTVEALAVCVEAALLAQNPARSSGDDLEEIEF